MYYYILLKYERFVVRDELTVFGDGVEAGTTARQMQAYRVLSLTTVSCV